MEDLLTQLMKDAQAAKFTPIRQACQNAMDVLQNKEEADRMPAYLLREKCLEPLQLALESRTKRLMTRAVSGIEKILKDERFQSSIEPESENRWLPIQILNAVYSTPNLPEDIQVDVMKLLLKMTFSTAWCMNSRIITQVVQVYIDTYSSSSTNLKAVVQAALTQLLTSFAEKLRSAMAHVEHAEDDIMSDFNAKGDSKVESLTDDVVTLLNFLTDKVTAAHRSGQSKLAIPLLLEGIYAILTNSPTQLRNNFGFQQLVWQNLCPTLIALLGIPKAEAKQKSAGEHGRNIECPSLLPNTAKIIYSISVVVAKMVGPVRSLRPVLESLFHRILLCPAPQHRHDAIKAIKQLMASPATLCDLTVTYSDDVVNTGKAASPCNDLALVKLMVDSIQECCHTTDSNMCFTAITCVDDLLAAIEQLEKGNGIHGDSVKVIQDKYRSKQGKYRILPERASSVKSQSDIEDNVAKNVNNHNSSSMSAADNPANTVFMATKQASAVIDNKISQIENVPNTINSAHIGDDVNLSDYKIIERQSAKQFLEELSRILPYLLSLSTIPEVDEALQKFSSSFSDTLLSSKQVESLSLSTVLNGDSIYATSYAALCLNLHLSAVGYFGSRDRTLVPMSERWFIDGILDTDMFLYLSPDWLAEVYRCVIEKDLFTEAGWSSEDDVSLIYALKDIDGQGSQSLGGQMLREAVCYEQEEETGASSNSDLVKAGKLLARQILSTCWDGLLDVLSVLLNGRSVCGVTNTFAIIIGTEGAKEEELRKREALCNCLNGLQKAANLCCTLGLQERCAVVFAMLANTSCVMEDFRHATQGTTDRTAQKSSIIPQSKPKLVRLHTTHVLSMDAMMTNGLEIGSHSADCWKHVFRCCAFISELEHTYFSSGNNQSSLPRIHQEHAVDMATNVDNDPDVYGIPMAPVVPIAPRINVPNLIKQSSIESGWDRSISGGGVLNSVQASHALCGLSQEVDRLFEEAANNLNMTSLVSFLSNLCEASKCQLQKLSRKVVEEEDHPGEYHLLPVNSLHLYRLQNVLMTVAHSDRPLIHLIKAWSVISAYLVEMAGHKDRSISKMAVTCVHDYIIAVMSRHSELKHFHTNEMLCKTFENILCLELCDGDVQDQIVCSICELVEASAADVKSGWRPLFGALRAVRIEYTTIEEVNAARQRHIEAVLDVFDVYLNTDNILVFANATVDYILCLLKYVRGPGEFDDSDSEDSDSVNDYMVSSPSSENLCVPALQYLKQCSIILQSMWKMPACPVFHGAKRIQVNTSCRCVDPNIPNMNFKKFSKYFITEGEDENIDARVTMGADTSPGHDYHMHRETLHIMEDKVAGDSSSLHSNDSGIIITGANKDTRGVMPVDAEMPAHVDLASLDDMDNDTGILHVWFLLLEGLSGAISACPKLFQPHTMETLFELLRSASHIPGAKFGVYCVNHLLLPMIQSWLRSGSRKFGYWEAGATNFKQCCGHTTDLVVDLVRDFKDDKEISPLLETVLSELLVVLTECVAQPFEVISRLGCSCIRHVLLSASSDFSEAMWQIIIDGLQKALNVTTYCVRQLMLLFKANSENFYGDIGQVKVATRKDCTEMEFYRLWHLAQQVFLLDSQVSMDLPDIAQEEDKSYVFLLYPPGYENSLNPDHILARVPFRSIVFGLLSHQLLLQTVGCILLEGSDSPDSSMPGMLSQLSTKHVTQLLDCLRNSYKLACEFDLRPGLKFLVQKVAHTQVAVNLYKQAGASMVFYIHTLIKICSNMPGLSLQSVRALLSKEIRNASSESENMMCHDGGNEPSKDNGNIKDESENVPSYDEKDALLSKELIKEATESQNMLNHDGGKEEDDPENKYRSDDSSSSINQSNEELATNDEAEGELEVCGESNGASSNQDLSSIEVTASNDANIDKSCAVDTNTDGVSPNANTELRKDNDTKIKNTAKNGEHVIGPRIVDSGSLFVSQLRCMCEELCQMYIDIVYDKAGTSCVDDMGDQQLFFLIAQPDELPEVHNKLDLMKLSSQLEQTQARLQGQVVTQVISVQGDEDGVISHPASTRAETESVLPPLSPVHSSEKSKREMRTDHESRVYNLATDKLIKNLMTQYKKHKNQNAMPTFSKVPKKEKKGQKLKKKSSSDPVEQVIEQQQHSSIMKDSEAHVQSWTELLCTILGLFNQLNDSQFTTLLPTVFDSVNHLVCHAQDMRLREDLAQWLHRVGTLFALSPASDK